MKNTMREIIFTERYEPDKEAVLEVLREIWKRGVAKREKNRSANGGIPKDQSVQDDHRDG